MIERLRSNLDELQYRILLVTPDDEQEQAYLEGQLDVISRVRDMLEELARDQVP